MSDKTHSLGLKICMVLGEREQSWFDSHLVFVLTVMLSEPLSLIPDMLAVLPGLLVNELLQR